MADSQRKSYNLFDVEFEQGSLNTAASVGTTLVNMYSPSDIRIRAKTLLKVEGLGTITISFNTAKYEILLVGFTNENYYDRKATNWLSASTTYPLSGFDSNYIDIIVRRIDQSEISPDINDLNLMLNTGSTAKPYEPYGWVHSLRKFGTATEAVENPLYSDGTAITAYTLKGNTVQNGTPTPANPVDVQGVGERTDNLYPFPYTSNLGLTGSGQNRTVNTMSYQGSSIVKLEPNTTYYMSGDRSASQDVNGVIAIFDELPTVGSVSTHFYYYNSTIQGGVEFTTDATETYGLVVQRSSADYTTDYHMMLNTGSTAKTYEPHGYKIPISNGQQTIDIYIGDLPLLKSLDGTAVDEINNGTLTRRVDSDGSVLPTPTTTQITMPSIPTTEGANSITVDTTVQPSEFTATWTGWHNSSVKEWDGSQWNE